jgi:3-deoxy-manno-octulosonate cytidylyltransferase (CMP-KDO synthetase)
MACDLFKHLGIYAYRRDFLDLFRRLPEGSLEAIEKLEQLRALEWGHPIRVVVTEYDSPEVDLPEDISRIEQRLRQMPA